MNKFLKMFFASVLSCSAVAGFADEGDSNDNDSEVSAEAKGDKGCGCPHAEVTDQTT